ncbi:MAG: DUF1326 domain-containing protein [Pseudomonadota bacterium]
MARIDWLIVGKSFGNCNCDYGCPCQFESLPTHGACRGFEVFEIDIEARKATASIPGVLETEGRPIKSPATGQDHWVRIDMPGGIEFDIAEIGSGSATTKGAIAFTLKDSYGQFNRLRHHGGGVIH